MKDDRTDWGNRTEKLETLADSEGFNDPMEMAETIVTDSVVPGICMTPGCNYTTEVEPDNDAGWCEFCRAQTVVSGLVLMGII